MMGGEWTSIAWLAMGMGMILWVVALAVVIGVVVAVLNRAQRPNEDRPGDSADEVLRRRFAGGDIDAAEFERRLTLLRR